MILLKDSVGKTTKFCLGICRGFYNPSLQSPFVVSTVIFCWSSLFNMDVSEYKGIRRLGDKTGWRLH